MSLSEMKNNDLGLFFSFVCSSQDSRELYCHMRDKSAELADDIFCPTCHKKYK